MNRNLVYKSVWVVIFALFAAASGLNTAAAQSVAEPTTPYPAYDATGAMRSAVVYSHEVQASQAPIAYRYDATGTMRASVVYTHEVTPRKLAPAAYDATGAMLNAVIYSHQVSPDPAFAGGSIPNTGGDK